MAGHGKAWQGKARQGYFKMIIQYDEYETETELAWGVIIDHKIEWFPKSLCTIDEDDKTMKAPSWLIIEKKLEMYET